MLDVLEGLVRQYGQGAVVENKEIPNEHNEGIIQDVTQGILGGLTSQANAQGGLGSLLSLFTGGGAGQSQGVSGLMSNPMVQMIAKNVMGNIMQKYGLSNNAASGVIGNILPSVLGGLISKTNDPNDNSVDLGGLMGTLSGGKTNGIDFGSIMGQASNALADGKLDMNDLLNLASGGGSKPNAGGGGLGDLLGGLGGLFGKK
jgi:hypothetical protein